ncbi:MAG: DNA primase [Planctomycetota bacterium]
MTGNDHDFRRAIEEIKLRASIEEIVGETVDLTPRGKTLWGCCPFHDERTPSFKIDPAMGTWYCFGACRKGGDVISFVQERNQLTFMDALELLAGQFGITLPRRKPRRSRENDPGLAALAFAEAFFRKELGREEGRVARRYLEGRGFGESAIEAFGLGWAPRGGGALLGAARREGITENALIEAGLARRSDRGDGAYSFFRGRMMIPIRDERGTTVAFGGRVVGDDDGPKYVNTSETRYFHKGRVIYALDRAIDAVRRGGHLILVEGYTDVIAAHVAGLRHVGAVLGTATTDMHAALVRKAGARRVSLVFDGDEAGRRAAWRGLEGLLPLDVRLEVVPLPEGLDPADVCGEEGGAERFAARVEAGLPWLDFVAECVRAKRAEGGKAFALEVDRALELVRRLSRPVEADAALVSLAGAVEVPADTVRQQFAALPRMRGRTAPGGAQERPGRGGGGPGPGRGSGAREGESPDSRAGTEEKAPLDPRVRRAYGSLLGAALVDAGLIPRLRPWIVRCPMPDLAHVFQVLVDLWDNEDSEITANLLMSALGEHPVRNVVAGISEHARTAEDPTRLFEGAVWFLEQQRTQDEIQRLTLEIQRLESAAEGDPSSAAALETALSRLIELRRVQPGPAAPG